MTWCKNGWSGPEYNHLDREQYVDTKPGGTWDSRYQERNLLRKLIISNTVCDHHDTTALILRDTRAGYQLKKEGCKINHLLFMDDLKLYGKDSSQMDSLVQTVWSYSEDIGMKFGIDKCGCTRTRKRETSKE